jgi:hypothetical protein
MSDELKTIKFQLMLSPIEAGAIDDWGFKNRIRTRAEAIRRLCQIGLLFDEKRMDLLQAFVKVNNTAGKLAELAKHAAEGGQITELEREMILNGLDISEAITSMFPLIRAMTGLAKKLKSDGDLEEVMTEAEEIMDILNSARGELEPVSVDIKPGHGSGSSKP